MSKKCKVYLDANYASANCGVPIDSKFCEKLFGTAAELKNYNLPEDKLTDYEFQGFKVKIDSEKTLFTSGNMVILAEGNVKEIKIDPKNKIEDLLLKRKEMRKLDSEIKYFYNAASYDQRVFRINDAKIA